MTGIGMLLSGDSETTPTSFVTGIADRLGELRAAGVDFDTAWTTVVHETRAFGFEDNRPESVHLFARLRFERAYYGLPASMPVCQHPDGCPNAQPCPHHPNAGRALDDNPDAGRALAAGGTR